MFDILLIIGCLIFLYKNRVFILTQPKIKAKVTSRVLNHLPKDGVLVEGLICQPIAYQSHKRVVVIPHDPDRLLAGQQFYLSKEKFDLHYAVFSDRRDGEYPAIDYIKSFKLIKEIREDNDKYYIYEI